MARHLTPVTYFGDKTGPVQYDETSATGASEWVVSDEPIRRAEPTEFALVDGARLVGQHDGCNYLAFRVADDDVGLFCNRCGWTGTTDAAPVVEPVGDAGGPSATVGDPEKLSDDTSQAGDPVPAAPDIPATAPDLLEKESSRDADGATAPEGGKTVPAVGRD
jgi:hypothetical protein